METMTKIKTLKNLNRLVGFGFLGAAGISGSLIISKVVDKIEKEGGIKAVLVKGKNEISELSGKCKQGFANIAASGKDFKGSSNEEVDNTKKAEQASVKPVKTKTTSRLKR